jgi:anti-sigma B factor antagonist
MRAPRDETLPDQVVVRLAGELDLSNVAETSGAIRRAVAQGRSAVALHLEDVSFIDSSGLRAILAARSDAEERGCCVWIAGTSAAVLRLLELTRQMALTTPPPTPTG